MITSELNPLPVLPNEWLSIESVDRISGPGYTRWRDWSNDYSITTAVSYNSHTSGLESLRAKVVGLYLGANDDTVLGILVSKRIKGLWTKQQLILLDRIQHWVNLDTSQLIHGEALTLARRLLKNLHSQISKSNINSDSGRKAEDQYLLGECTELHRGLSPLLQEQLVEVLSSLDFSDDDATERIALALQTANSQLI